MLMPAFHLQLTAGSMSMRTSLTIYQLLCRFRLTALLSLVLLLDRRPDHLPLGRLHLDHLEAPLVQFFDRPKLKDINMDNSFNHHNFFHAVDSTLPSLAARRRGSSLDRNVPTFKWIRRRVSQTFNSKICRWLHHHPARCDLPMVPSLLLNFDPLCRNKHQVSIFISLISVIINNMKSGRQCIGVLSCRRQTQC